MARSIRAHVQVDRLPDVKDPDVKDDKGKTFIMLGLRVSAAIVPGLTTDSPPTLEDPAKDTDAALILPWLWLNADGKQPWTAHSPDSWQVYHYRVADQMLLLIGAARLHFLNPDNTGVGLFDPKKIFRNRMADEVEAIVKAFGPRQAFEIPARDGVISGRTAYGLAESLTALPNPVPAAMNVWTAAWVDKEDLEDFKEEDRFLAAPVFAVANASYDPEAPKLTDERWTAAMTKVDTGADPLEAETYIHPSLELSRLAIVNNPERLIDLSNLTIRAKEGEGFEGGDWIASVGMRLAEAIDPAARAMAVLDKTIADATIAETVDDEEAAAKARQAFIDDMTSTNPEPPRDSFRTALRELHRPIVTPRARRSAAAMAPAAAFLEALAVQAPQLWPKIIPYLFAHAGAENGVSTPDDSTPAFDATTCDRLLGAAGVPPSPERRTADGRNNPAVAASDRVPVLDSEADFVAWLVRHWTTFPKPREGNRSFAGTTPRLTRGDVNTPTTVVFEPVGVVDFDRVPADTEVTVAILSATAAPLEGTAKVVWHTPGTNREGSRVTVELTFENGKTILNVNGEAVGDDIPSQLGGYLSFKIRPDSKLLVTYLPMEKDVEKRSKEVDAARAGRIAISVDSHTTTPINVGIADPSPGATPVIDRDRLMRQAQTLRAALAWAYAGSIVPELLQGWPPLVDEKVEKTFQDHPLAVRLSEAADVFIQKSFAKAFADAGKGLNHDSPLFEIYRKLQANAIEDAHRLARSIVPPALGDADRITEDALPLAFLISQLQDYDEKDDLWGRLAGVGVLISRDTELANDEWWSLNAASLHVAHPGAEGRQPLTELTAVLTATPVGEEKDEPWKRASKVDPVPLSVGDVGGVRTALIKYENHSIVGEVENAPQLDSAAPGGGGPRRPEAFLFPPTNFTRMPALTFGRKYGILPYLIGHGGALPVPLREEPFNPVVLKKPDPDDKKKPDKFKITRADLGKPGDRYVYVRETSYPRTVPVSAPRIGESQWPGTFPGVDPLADELPLRPPPMTLAEGTSARFFRDKSRLTGLLSSRDDGIRIEIGEITATPAVEASTSLELRVETRQTDGATSVVASVVVALSKLRSAVGADAHFGLRIEMGRTTKPELWVLKRREQDHADDEPLATTVDAPANTPDITVEVKKWDSAYLVVTATGGTFEYEPPTIRWGAKSADVDDKTLVLAGDRPILPPELAHAARKVAVMDGIQIGAPTGPTTVSLDLRRPAAPVATYERWINGPTGEKGSADVAIIRKAIDAARNHATTLGRGDRSVDDPAVEAIFAEVVQLFPRRLVRKVTGAVDGRPFLLSQLQKDLEKVLGVKPDPANAKAYVMVSDVIAKVVATVDKNRRPDEAQDKMDVGKVTDGTLKLSLAPGCVYEIRLYAAIPAQQDDLFDSGTAERFSPAVRASWREAEANSKVWHLGTPLTLTVEVATEIMPECWNDANFKEPAFALDFARPPAVVEDRALVRLVPENLGPPILRGQAKAVTELRYAALRYVNRAALMHQRWSWRGRPHPQISVDEPPQFGTKGQTISLELGKFVDAAFLGRADDDIGVIREVAFGRAHAAGGQPVIIDPVTDASSTAGKRPVLMEHDLDRRAGTHLWRFGLRLKSRYAAMRPNHPDLLRFSHLERGSNTTHWWRVVVPDRVPAGQPPRVLDRPSLMLVLPLTEPLMTEGSVPPLLAVFNQELFPQFNAADGIEAVIDVARHPFPGHERIKRDQEPQNDPGTTFGKLFDDAWRAVKEARKTFEEAETAYTVSLAIGSGVGTAQQAILKGKRTDALKGLQAAETAFKEVQEKGAAWGVFRQWDDVAEQVKEAIRNATTEEQKKRLQHRLDVEIPAEKAKAEEIALAIESGTLPASVVAGAPANPFTKYYQEISPDTMREATPAADRPVAIRVDGPVGYTFDAGTEAGRFDHAALLVSPVAEVVRPGSFVRLRFRRLETPGLLVAAGKPDPTWPDEPPAALSPPLKALPADGARFLIARPSPDSRPAADEDVHRFLTVHEGLGFELPDLAEVSPLTLRFMLVPPVGDEPCGDDSEGTGEGTTVLAKIEEAKGAEKKKIVVSARTYLGPSTEWSLPLSEGATTEVQILVSLRPKPNTGPDAEVQKYSPAGDVSVRVRITPDDVRDPVRRMQDQVWLSVLCMPLNTTRPFTDLVAVRACPTWLKPEEPLPIAVKPLRLSDFAPAVWCQFAALMSRFEVDAQTSMRRILDVLPVSALTVRLAKSAKTFTMGLKDLRAGEKLSSLTLRTEGRPDDESEATRAQIEEPIYAIVTRFVYDAFDRLRERAIGIHPLDGPRESTLSFGPRIWPPGKEEDREPYTANMKGRVRFLRVVRGKLREQGGFETRLQEFPGDFFGRESDEALDADPFDAAGMAMGISTPIEWDGSDSP